MASEWILASESVSGKEGALYAIVNGEKVNLADCKRYSVKPPRGKEPKIQIETGLSIHSPIVNA